MHPKGKKLNAALLPTSFDSISKFVPRLHCHFGYNKWGSTLVVGEEAVNISPQNRDYEGNVYSMPPQPGKVSNAVIGFVRYCLIALI